ncbi:MAG TPA: hypothetical protein PK228_00725 [Saprospiraceae bacterium]|nr:hypothetical protein [Saprospiraceae bacterium]
METQISVEQILNKASQLNARDFEHLFANLNLLRARRAAPSLSKNETNLLKKINEGFPLEKWTRIAQLDEKMEFSELTEAEADEHLALAEELETYTVQRFLWLKQLASLRKVSVEQVMKDLDLAPR